MREIGIYVHIPFCKQKCHYCDFVSFPYDESRQKQYIQALINEIYIKKNNEIEGIMVLNNMKEQEEVIISTIYIGGGTPSAIASQHIIDIIDMIKKNFTIKENAEITIEINPCTVTKEKLIDYQKAGINRVSIGLQSTHNRLLKLIGRLHTYEEFLKTYALVKAVGFTNINIDLMLGLPSQTLEELTESVIQVIHLKPNHISIYSLMVEEGTPLEDMLARKELVPVTEEIERKMYWKMKRILEKSGYAHYEISNFAQKGFESQHNLNCWNQEEYLGFGLAAHSYWNNKRFSNTNNIENYIQSIEKQQIGKIIEIHEEQSQEDKAKEFMLLGLRKIEGVSISVFEQKFKINPLFYFRFEISKLVEEDLIEVDLDVIRLTKRGLDLANRVFEEFV